MEKKLQNFNQEQLKNIILEMKKALTEEQYKKLELLVQEYVTDDADYKEKYVQQRMSREFVNEKMSQIKKWMQQIDNGEVCLNIEEYEDYSDNYWDRDWIVEYNDN